jgi:trans-2,3-dihydro-3-hydroxyanthranilate isomerase
MSSEPREYAVLDVFTDRPLEGNPVAVFTDARGLDQTTMQRLARELNLSETVFVFEADADCDARIRIFTPALELPFAGHPVLGTAILLGEQGGLEHVRLGTASGVVQVALRRERGSVTYGEMSQPLPSERPFERADELLQALGVGHAELPIIAYDNGPVHVCVTLGSPEAVAALRPDLNALAALGRIGVSCFAAVGTHCKTRMFGPGLGVSEDPAAGSAAGPIALHLVRHARIAFGQQIEISQGAEIGRPSQLYAQVDGSADRLERIAVGGSAVHVASGSYRLG